MIVFMDESGFSLRPSIRRTWAPRGQTPIVREQFNWKRLSAMGALGWHPKGARIRLFLSLRSGAVRGETVLGFLRSLRRHIRGLVVLIWDGLSAHRSQEVRGYLQAQRHWLRVERLPAHAPELNPLEGLWGNLKGCELANFLPDDLGQLAHQVRKGVQRVRRRKQLPFGFFEPAQLLTRREFTNLCKNH